MNTSIAQTRGMKPPMQPCLSMFLLCAVFRNYVAAPEVDCRVRGVDEAASGAVMGGMWLEKSG